MNILSIGFDSICDIDFRVRREPQRGTWFLMLTKTRVRFTLGGATLKMPENTLIIYDDSAVQDYGADGCAFVCDWICFDPSDDPDQIDITINRPMLCPDPEFVSTMIRAVAEEFYSLSARRTKMLDSLMRTLLVKIGDSGWRRDSQAAADPHYSALFELREKIYRNPQLKWNVDTMAADVNMSRSYFQHIYREVFGVSCISDVISGKVEKAKEILTETGCTVSQVAAMCGYDNEEHFMRQFKKIVGVTPTRYRKK